ncbi:1-phosphofructokinase family hexose kinase [Microbacterium hominis]|uniref:Carbohydrate kinase PfkB domain-containing protein n=1 Tax=Microbacterium hominis TaxID=162426 RepID=A0A7D4PZT0_9MICO|nr:PfkB family carbohydrate kinase [Microbacterium hominis]QKJ18278.1 hypothetical protein HQM25_01920 [Microbacterium hominis]
MIVALAISPSLDVTYEVEQLRHGEITRPIRVTRVAGGKALNAARVARAFGAEVRAIAALGGHAGAAVAELLAADDVPTRVVSLAAETRTCMAIVEGDGATSSTDIYEPAAPLTAHEWSQLTDEATAAVGDRRPWVAVSGSLPESVPTEAAVDLIMSLQRAGARVALDSSGRGLRTLGPVVELVKVNRAEAEEFVGGAPRDAEESARALNAAWGCDVVVTDGVRGGFGILDTREIAVPAPRRLGRFPAGSGDAFFGALLAGLDRGADAEIALTQARDAAERNAAVPGQGVLADPL